MEDLDYATKSWDAADTYLLMCVGALLAAAFVGYVIYEAIRRKRKRARFGHPGGSVSVGNYVRRLRRFWHRVDTEFARRQRHVEQSRSHHRGKWNKWNKLHRWKRWF